MPTMNVSLSEDLKDFVDARVSLAGYSTHSEYIRELIRRDQQHAAEKQLAAKIAEGLNSPLGTPIDKTYWTKKRALARKLTR